MKPASPSSPSTSPWKDAFDARFRIHTGEEIPLHHLAISSPNVAAGVKYQAVPVSLFQSAIAHVPRHLTFIDLGCGKGRALILAHEAGFRNIVGVEFAPELAATARANLALVSVTAEVIACDAADFNFPGGPLAIFLNNPFDGSVLKPVLDHLQARSEQGYVIYVAPAYEDLFSAFSLVASGPDWKVWKISAPLAEP